MAREVRCHLTDRQTVIHTTTTVTFAAHARQVLMKCSIDSSAPEWLSM